MWLLPFSGAEPDTSRLRWLGSSEFNTFGPRLSPDGRLLAYAGDESGKTLTYVAEWRPDGTIGRPIEVRTQGSNVHAWSADGRSLLIEDERRRLMRVAVARALDLTLAQPTEVFDLDELGVQYWAPLPDGRLFVGLKSDDEGEVTRYNLVLNWGEELKRKMRTAR